MSERAKEPLFHVAEAISDGTPVDWEREKTRKPSHRGALEHLAVLERIRDLYRRQPGEEADLDEDTRSSGAATASPGEPLFTWGPLRVLEKIGEGGWAYVYRAFEPSLETEVALKLLKDEVATDATAVEHFISEARRLARVRHENVLIVHGADRHGDRVGMWTELVHGQSLEAHLALHGPLSAREATLIGLDLCRALSAVHAAGLVHRDVKASNVMRGAGGRIVLMDFGSGVELRRPGALDATASIQGTPVTMAPEQLRGEVAGAATDIYGLGVLLYHLVSGRYPVEAESLPDLHRCHELRRYVPIRDRRADLSLGFVQVVERAIAPDPAYRYQTAGAMELALSATLVSEPRAWSQRVQERWGLVAAVVVLAAVTIGLGAWGLWKKKSLTDDAARGVAPVAASPAVSHGEALTAKATLLRLVGSLEEPVPPGGKIAPGDRLSLRLQGIEPMHVYVLDEDREGEMFVLFPVPGVEPANPIQASRTVRLPGTVADSLVYWKVTSPGVRESLIAIGAREPIEELDSLLSYLPRVEPGRAVEMSASATSAARKLRGIGGLQTLPEAHRTTARRRIEELLPQLEDRRARRGDIWIWRTELANPVPKS